MDDLLTCSVCCEPYQEKMRHPVLLPRCGHSFCRPCVSFLVMNGCVVCPSCRMDQRVETADHLPTEFSLLAITNAQQVTKMELCEPHGVKLSFWCKSCRQAACGECLFEDHPTHSHTVVKATRFFEETKEAVNDIASKFMDALDFREKWYIKQVFQTVKSINDTIRTISVLRRDLDDARELFKGVKVVEGFGPTTALSEASKCLGLKWNLQDCQLVFRSPGGGGKKEEEAAEEKEKDETETKEKETNEAKEKDTDEAEKEENEEKMEDSNTPEAVDEKEKSNGEKEKEASEKEKDKDIGEEETLTEEEKRKRRKILRLKEKLAAAAAAAEKEQLENRNEKVDLKKGDKEKISEVKRKASLDKDSAPSLAELKTRNMARKYVPLPREPSMSPERETTTTQTITEKDNKETDTDAASSGEKEAELTEKSETGDKKDEESQNKAKTETSEANKTTETTPGVDSKNEMKPKNKLEPSASSSAVGSKRTRGRLARQALKRSQTMNFSSQIKDDDSTQDSNNIKGLDLETNKTSKNEEPTVDNKDIEAQASGEVKEESNKKKEEADKEEERWSGKEEQGASKEKNKKPDGFFEMEPEEKERITTELMEVPNLTMVVEGIGGRQAYMTWEKEGLHVYCHQYQDLPYDVLIKSTVLHALIPTKSPTVFLDVGTEQKVLGRVYISLWGHLRRATNFLHLCLGDRGPSFRNTMFLEVLNADCPGERIRGGDYEQNNGRGGESLVDDLEFQEGYSMPMRAGMLTAGGPNRRELDSQFFICTEDDHDRKFACPFGLVTSGLPFMKEAVWLVVTKEMWIRDCGIVLDAPRI